MVSSSSCFSPSAIRRTRRRPTAGVLAPPAGSASAGLPRHPSATPFAELGTAPCSWDRSDHIPAAVHFPIDGQRLDGRDRGVTERDPRRGHCRRRSGMSGRPRADTAPRESASICCGPPCSWSSSFSTATTSSPFWLTPTPNARHSRLRSSSTVRIRTQRSDRYRQLHPLPAGALAAAVPCGDADPRQSRMSTSGGKQEAQPIPTNPDS